MKKRWREKEKNDLVELGTRQWFFQRGNVNAKIVHIIPTPRFFFWPFSNIFLTLFQYFSDPFPLFSRPFSIIFLTLFQYIFLTLFHYFADPFPIYFSDPLPIFFWPFSNIFQTLFQYLSTFSPRIHMWIVEPRMQIHSRRKTEFSVLCWVSDRSNFVFWWNRILQWTVWYLKG